MILQLFLLASLGPSIDRDVVYGKIGADEVKMNIHLPAEQKQPGPAVVVIHGGAWMAGKKEDMTDIADMLAKEGFVAATIQYRLAPKSKWPAQLDDCQTAVRFLRANAAKYKIDPKRTGALGASAGGHLSLLLGMRETRDSKPAQFATESSRVQCVVDLFGPTDCDMFPQGMEVVYQMVLGKPRKDAEAEIFDASPINFVTKTTAPIFIYQGLADQLVEPEHSRKLERKLKENGVPFEAVYLEGVGHSVPRDNKNVEAAILQAIAFLKKHLGPMK